MQLLLINPFVCSNMSIMCLFYDTLKSFLSLDNFLMIFNNYGHLS